MKDSKELLKLFNERVKQIETELNMSEDDAFIKVIMITATALHIFDSLTNILKEESK